MTDPLFSLALPFCSMDIINRFGLSKRLLLFVTGLDGCLYLDGGAAVCAALCYTVGFPGTGTKRQLELVSPLQIRKYRAVWETGRALRMLQCLGSLFLLGAGGVGGRRAEVIRSEHRRAVHSLQLPQWSQHQARPWRWVALTGEPGFWDS